MTNTLEFIKSNYLPLQITQGGMPHIIPNFGRNELAQLFNKLGYVKGAEIGVEKGEYSEVLLSANPDLTLYCVDAWAAYKGYGDHTRQEKLTSFYFQTKERLQKFQERAQIRALYSTKAVEEFEDGSLDFVYIDANHDFFYFTQDLHLWSRKVRKGGIIAGHDYITTRLEAPHLHVRQVLEGYTDAYQIEPWFILGREDKHKGEIRDDFRSWFFIK